MVNSKVWDAIAKKAEDDYASLSDNERVIYNLRKVIDAVNDRGLMSLYLDMDFYYAEDSIDDLYTAGLDEIAAVLESANAIFPGGCPPEDFYDRSEIIESWDGEYDEFFAQLTEDILMFSIDMESCYDKLISSIE